MKIFSRRFIQIIILLSMSSVQISFAASANGELNQKLQRLHTLKAQFIQTQYNPQGQAQESLEGQVVTSRPGHFRWETQKPNQQLLLTDGRKLWVYDIDLAQATEQPLQRNIGTMPAELLSGDSTILKKYFNVYQYQEAIKTKSVCAQAQKLIKKTSQTYCLIPKTNDEVVKVVIISFNDNAPAQIILLDQFDQHVSLAFTNVSVNPSLAADTFKLKLPKDMELIKSSA